MKVIHISDTHNKHNQIYWPFNLSDADMIIHSGDFSGVGAKYELENFFYWFQNLPIKYKIVIAGNHDKCFDSKFWGVNSNMEEYSKDIIKEFTKNENNFFLMNETIEIEGINIYGSPWSKWFHGDNWGFNIPLGTDEEFYSKLPNKIDILVTHAPPLGKLDRTNNGNYAGCESLLNKVKQIKPKYHLFGHIHEGAGETFDGDTIYLNSSIMNFLYEPVNSPQIFEI